MQDNSKVLKHVYIWECFHKRLVPSGMRVDHIDGDKENCSINNLRLVTLTQNAQNRKVRSDNKTGVTGVTMLPNGKYQAAITINGKVDRLGTFKKLEEAKETRKKAVQKANMEGTIFKSIN